MTPEVIQKSPPADEKPPEPVKLVDEDLDEDEEIETENLLPYQMFLYYQHYRWRENERRMRINKKSIIPSSYEKKRQQKKIAAYLKRKKQGKLYFKPSDFDKGIYAAIRPVQPNKEIVHEPESLFMYVTSSNLRSVAYSRSKRILEIEFMNRYRYRYYDVDIRVFKNLLEAPSHGKYFWRRIRRQPYRYRRIA